MSDNQTVSVSSLRGSSEDLGKGFWQQWQQYQDYLHRCCIKWMGGNPTDAEDALSRAMLKAWEKVQKFAGKINNFKAWLTTLTRNLCVDIYRERSRGANRVEDIEGYASNEEQGLLRSEDTPEIALETGEKRIVIRRAIDNLPTRLRETFILHFYQELSYPEIVQQQEISYQNVCKRISQARAILREELRGYFIEEEGTDTDKSVPSAATESAIGEMSQGNGGVEATVGETVTLSVAVEEVESVGGKDAIEEVRDVQHSESVMVAATNDGKLEVKRDGCRHVEAVLGEVSPLSSRRVLYPFYGAGLNPKIQKLTLAIVLYTEQGLIEKEKVKTMNPMSVNQESLPSFFRDVEIVGPAHLELPKYRAYHANAGISSSPKQGEVSAESTPILLANKAVKEIYQSNDFAKIKKLEANAQKDLQAVYDNVAQNKEKAWTKVEKDGKQFYMSWSQTGSMWAYTESNSLAKDGTYQAVVQVGTYSKSSQIIGIQTYNLTLSTFLVESVIAYIVARAVSSIIADGLGFLFTRFALYLAEAAAEAGLEAFAFNIPAAALSTVATCLVFAIVFKLLHI
ncbi:sigma-70 family RNA polymerase sigma factor [Microcoleus sp. B7-D4]|uniref:sigma-70 family RNA polymerase sigma factor n=1 Tax=Microcoleus sp. B7-D4 TaxID=2818696 RepID=UPI002FD5D18D